MPFVDTPLSGTMSWTAFDTNMDDFRTWVNSIPNADVANGAIIRQNLVRPVLGGFPINGAMSTLQASYHHTFGLGDTETYFHEEWGPRRYRMAFVPYIGQADLEYWRTPIARTIRLHRTSYVEVHIDLEWQTRSSTIGYPNGAGGVQGSGAAARCGFWAVHKYARSAQTENLDLGGIQHVYAAQTATTYSGDHGQVSMVDTLPADVYDLGLVYHRSAAPNTLDQIDIGRCSLHIEVL